MKKKKHNPFLFVGMVGILGLVFILYVWGKVDLVRVGYQLEELSGVKAALQREHDQLQLKVSRLTSPDRIALEAGRQLGLVPPGPEQVILVSVQPLHAPVGSVPSPDRFVTVAKNISSK